MQQPISKVSLSVRELVEFILASGSIDNRGGSADLYQRANEGSRLHRKLQRQGVPFAAGILPQNDLDYPVAKALAAALVELPPYQLAGEAELEQARRLMESCGQVVCTVEAFGPCNGYNARLWEAAGPKQADWHTL